MAREIEIPGETDEAGSIALDRDTELPDPSDPQVVVALAINDVIELARAMSRQKLGRGEIEMRRRLAVMDRAIELAERATGPVEGNA